MTSNAASSSRDLPCCFASLENRTAVTRYAFAPFGYRVPLTWGYGSTPADALPANLRRL